MILLHVFTLSISLIVDFFRGWKLWQSASQDSRKKQAILSSQRSANHAAQTEAFSEEERSPSTTPSTTNTTLLHSDQNLKNANHLTQQDKDEQKAQPSLQDKRKEVAGFTQQLVELEDSLYEMNFYLTDHKSEEDYQYRIQQETTAIETIKKQNQDVQRSIEEIKIEAAKKVPPALSKTNQRSISVLEERMQHQQKLMERHEQHIEQLKKNWAENQELEANYQKTLSTYQQVKKDLEAAKADLAALAPKASPR